MQILRTVIHSAPMNVWINVELRDADCEYEIVFDRASMFVAVPNICLHNYTLNDYTTFRLNNYSLERLALHGLEKSDALRFRICEERHRICPNYKISDWLFDNETITYNFSLIYVVMNGI